MFRRRRRAPTFPPTVQPDFPSPATELELATRVIEASSRDHPADDVLRETLKSARPRPFDPRGIAQSVYAYFRWRGWLDPSASLEQNLRLARDLAARFNRDPASFTDQELREHAVPSWIPGAMDVTPAWLRQLQAEPRLWLRLRLRDHQPPNLEPDLASVLAPPASLGLPSLPGACIHTGTQDLFRSPDYHAGRFEIQDVASQLVGFACNPKPGETWWDTCAGEGGKTLHLSDLMANKGLIWATDRSNRRLAILRRRAGRAGCFNYRTATWTGTEGGRPGTRFDGVLVDAPCTGVGTWGRHPHARWTTTPADVDELATIQSRLLAAAAGRVKPGGRILYAVCTLTRAETAGVADGFEGTVPGFEPLPLPNPVLPGNPPVARLVLQPEITRGNGMFIAAWRRTS